MAWKDCHRQVWSLSHSQLWRVPLCLLKPSGPGHSSVALNGPLTAGQLASSHDRGCPNRDVLVYYCLSGDSDCVVWDRTPRISVLYKAPNDFNDQRGNKRIKKYFSKEKRKEASKKGRAGGSALGMVLFLFRRQGQSWGMFCWLALCALWRDGRFSRLYVWKAEARRTTKTKSRETPSAPGRICSSNRGLTQEQKHFVPVSSLNYSHSDTENLMKGPFRSASKWSRD